MQLYLLLLCFAHVLSCVFNVYVLSLTQTHSINQSLRDLQSDQLRLSDELDREILRRNRYSFVSTQQSG